MPYTQRKTRLVSLALVIVACLALGTCVCTTWHAGMLRANRHQCPDRLKLIGFALHNYHQQYGSFPPAYTMDQQGQRLHSWRTLILPFYGLSPEENEQIRFVDFNKRWNESPNREVGQQMPQHEAGGVYKCWLETADPLSTSYLAMTGHAAALNGNVPVSLDDISDPTNTVLVVERSGSGIHWMEPRDMPSQDRDTRSEHPGGFHVLFADGRVEFVTTLSE